MAGQDDRLSALDSPWLQLGVPLAAIAAQAIAPRHAGPAARATMYGWNSLNDYRLGEQRISALKAEEARKQKETEDYQKAVAAWGLEDAEASGAKAPEGGNVPEVQSELQGAAINSGTVIPPHASPDPRLSQLLKLMPPEVGWKMMTSQLESDRELSEGIDFDPNELAKIQSTMAPFPGMDYTGVKVKGGGKIGYKRDTPQLFKTETAGEGGARKESVAAVDPQGLSETRVSDIGLAPVKQGDQPEHNIVTEGDSKFIVYTNPSGIVAKHRIGAADEPDEKALANFDAKMELIAMGHPQLAGSLGNSSITKDEAKAYIEAKRNRPALGIVNFDPTKLPPE